MQQTSTYLWVPVHETRGPWWAVAHCNRSVSLKRALSACTFEEFEKEKFFKAGWSMQKAVATILPVIDAIE